jgi:outer membrane protein OmpA-like peptidoglycan-associated protein
VTEPPRVIEERRAPVAHPDSARLPRVCAAPERLTGVPEAEHFDLDRHELSVSTRHALDRTVAALAEYRGVRIRLAGHTDARHTEAYTTPCHVAGPTS